MKFTKPTLALLFAALALTITACSKEDVQKAEKSAADAKDAVVEVATDA